MPGDGGTQRFPRAIGKAKAMELVLTGRRMTAHEAEKAGLVARVFPDNQVLDKAIELAEEMCAMPPITLAFCKESINSSYELPLAEGLLTERRISAILHATNDRKEGMLAFVEKRDPKVEFNPIE